MEVTMLQRRVCLIAVLMLTAVTAAEARSKFEVGVGGGARFGGSFSDGSYNHPANPNDIYLDQLEIATGSHFGINLYVPLRGPARNGEALKFELFFNMASSDLLFEPHSTIPDEIASQFERDGDKLILGDVDVSYLHGGVIYQFGNPSGWNPHVNFGLGATIFSAPDGDFEETKFSLSLGGGVTKMFNETFGTRLQLRTYFTAFPADEYWVDRYGYIWEVTDTNLFFQGDISVGIVIAF
jgi:hypothetical protein